MEVALKKIQDKLQQSFKRVGGGSKFFGGAKRGEAAELTAELNCNDKERQKNAVKRVIANMTLGRDVSQLFTDVVKLGQTLNLELKKLVYLYVLNTARLQQDKALMAVNTFLQDANHASPIIRALAIRTMMCIRIASVTEYTVEPLRRAAKDTDPYVRKTAAIGLGKMYHQAPVMFADLGLMDDLLALLNDNFSVVASNAATVLTEIIGAGKQSPLIIKTEWINRVLNSLADATEWSQCFYLDFIALYQPGTPTEAETIIERTVARLSHSNPAVVLGAIKVLVQLLPMCSSEVLTTHSSRINAALLSLIKAEPEIQYVACRNIQLLLRLFPTLLSNNVDTFFIRFTDPPYVKAEKLKILLRLTTVTNAPRVVRELAEYSTEVDLLFVRDVVHAMASAAIKVESSAPEVVQMMLGLVEKRPELLPDIVNAAKNVVRKYPELCLDLVAPLLAQHGAEGVADEEAKVSLVWMLGEFCDVLENGATILREFLDTFMIQEHAVQLALLTAVVKIFLRNPAGMEQTLNAVLELVVQQSNNADLRDRAYFYWRLLAEGVGVDAMKHIVHGRKAPVDVDTTVGHGMSKGDIVASINTAAAVFGRPARTFVAEYGLATEDGDDDDELEDDAANEPPTPSATESNSISTASHAVHNGAAVVSAPAAPAPPPAPKKFVDPLDDIFGPGPAPSPPAPAPAAAAPPGGFVYPGGAAATFGGGLAAQARPQPANPVTAAAFDPFASPPRPTAAAAAAAAPPPAQPTAAAAPRSSVIDDIFGAPAPQAATAAPAAPVATLPPPLPQVVDPAMGNGLRICAALHIPINDTRMEVFLTPEQQQASLDVLLHNTTAAPIGDFVLQINRNAFGFVPIHQIAEIMQHPTVAPGANTMVRIPIRVAHTHFDAQKLLVEVGLKSSVGLALFTLAVEPFKLLLQPPPMERADFASKWSSLDATNEVRLFVPGISKFATADPAEVKGVLSSFNIGIVATQSSEKLVAFYGAVRTHLSITALVEIVANKENPATSTLSVKSLRSADIVPAVVQVLEAAAQRLAEGGAPKRPAFF